MSRTSNKIRTVFPRINEYFLPDIYQNEPNRPSRFFFFKSRRIPLQFHPNRRLMLNVPDEDLPNNSISTSKYNILSFFPINLLEQFSKPANFYFLIIGGLQIVPSITNTDSQPTIYLPLFAIIIISMIKDLFEDLKRHRADNEENNKNIQKLSQGKFEKISWKEVKCGDIVKVKQGEYFAADMLILQTSEPKGVCYIETKNLDGETNLKNKMAHKDVGKEFREGEMMEKNVGIWGKNILKGFKR